MYAADPCGTDWGNIMAYRFELPEANILHVIVEGKVGAEEFRQSVRARVEYAAVHIGSRPYALIYDLSHANLMIIDPRLTTWSMTVDNNLVGVVAISTQMMATVALKLFRAMSNAEVDVMPTYESALEVARAMLEQATILK